MFLSTKRALDTTFATLVQEQYLINSRKRIFNRKNKVNFKTIFNKNQITIMTPIIENQKQDTILTKDITWQHLVVAVIDGKPCILGKPFEKSGRELTFFTLCSITNCITYGNGYDYSTNEDTPQKMVEYALGMGNKVAVFNQSDWKDALKWLIDNCSEIPNN